MKKKLVRILGRLSELRVYDGEEDFLGTASQRTAGVVLAAGLAAIGLSGAAAGASSSALSIGDAVQFFTCRIGGFNLTGRFSRASFEIGDELLVIADSRTGGEGEVLAIARPKDQTLWMIPHCSRGAQAHRIFCLKMFAGLQLAIFAFLGVIFAIFYFRNEIRDPQFALYSYVFIGVNALLIGGYYAIRFYFQWRPLVQQAERIFETLGYLEPSRVDLPRGHKRYCKEHALPCPYESDGPWIYRYLDLERT